MVTNRQPPPAGSAAKSELLRCLEESNETLLNSIQIYAQHFGLARHDDARTVAMDVLQEVTVEALEHADRFVPGRRPVPWLLGIALNIIRRKKVELAKREHREQTISALSAEGWETGVESGMHYGVFDQTAAALSPDQMTQVEADDAAASLLALIPAADRDVLRLAFIDGWDRERLARELGTTVGAARVRLHRALTRLRTAWLAQQAEERKGTFNA